MERASRWHRACRKAEIEEARRQMAATTTKMETVSSLSLFLEVINLEVQGKTFHQGFACLGGGGLVGKMGKRAAEGLVETDLRSAEMETTERTCRSSHV